MNTLLLPVAQAQFEGYSLDVFDYKGERWVKALQVGEALGFAKPTHAITNIYLRNKRDFTPDMTDIVWTNTKNGLQKTRIFSRRGALLAAAFAQTEKGTSFRKWMLDVLEGKQPALNPREGGEHRGNARLILPLLRKEVRRVAGYRERGFTVKETSLVMSRDVSTIRRYWRSLEQAGLFAEPSYLAASRKQGLRLLLGVDHGA